MARSLGLGNTKGMEAKVNRSNNAAENDVAINETPPVNGAGNDVAIDVATQVNDAENDVANDGAPPVNDAENDVVNDGAPSVNDAENDVTVVAPVDDAEKEVVGKKPLYAAENDVAINGAPPVNGAGNDVAIDGAPNINDAENDIAFYVAPSVNDAENNVTVGAPVNDAETDVVDKKPVSAAENDAAIAIETPLGNGESSVVRDSAEGLLVHNSETSMGKEQNTHHHHLSEVSGLGIIKMKTNEGQDQGIDMNKEPGNGHNSASTPNATSLLEVCSSDQTGALEVIQLNSPLICNLLTETANSGGNLHQLLQLEENRRERNTQGGPDVVDFRIPVVDVNEDESMDFDENQEFFNEFDGPDVVDFRIPVIDVNEDESMDFDENQEFFNEFEVSDMDLRIQRTPFIEFVQQLHDHEFVRVSDSGSMNFSDFDEDQEFINEFESNTVNM